MKYLALFLVSCIVVGVRASWQFGVWNIPTPRPTVAGTAATTPAPSTAASQQYLACMQSCPSTSEYNPICGTDNINYHNNGRLECARRCGQNVAAVRMGTCQPQ